MMEKVRVNQDQGECLFLSFQIPSLILFLTKYPKF